MIVKDITEKFMLLRLVTACYGAKKKDEKASDDAIVINGAKSNSGVFTKNLSMHPAIKRTQSTFRAIRAHHRHATLPWNRTKNEDILPAVEFEEYMRNHEKLKSEAEMAVGDLIANWQQVISQASLDLGKLFDVSEYPDVDTLKTKFRIHLDPGLIPDSDDLRITTSIEAKRKLSEMIDDQNKNGQKLVMEELWKKLQYPVKKMATALKDPDKVFHKTLIGNLLEVTKVLSGLNITNDPDVIQMIQDVEDNLCIHSPEDLKENKDLRKDTATAAVDLAQKMAGFMGQAV